jgi:hypothetical protein
VHTAMIILHAAAGVAAFVAGGLVLRPPEAGPRAQRLFQLYLLSLGSMVVFLLGAPGWLVAALAVLGVVAGNRALHQAEARAQAAG